MGKREGPPTISSTTTALSRLLNINISNMKVSISFAGNEAVMSSAVLVINLDLCAFVRLGQPWFNTSRTFRWNFVDYR